MHALASHIAFQYHLRPLQPITRKVNFNKNNDIAQKHAHHTCYNTGYTYAMVQSESTEHADRTVPFSTSQQ